MTKTRLDQTMFVRGIVSTRSQAESWIKLGRVFVDGKIITKPGYFVAEGANIELKAQEKYVSRAGLKLASVAKALNLDFKDQVVLDVGSSTGGFTDFALQKRALKVIAVDVGTNQMHPSLRQNPKVDLHEQTDIRNFKKPSVAPDIVVIDVSFISLRDILPSVKKLCTKKSQIVAMVKPQFESSAAAKHKGVVKNDSMRRAILRDFEIWAKQSFIIKAKSDSEVAGAKGNRERFYLLKAS